MDNHLEDTRRRLLNIPVNDDYLDEQGNKVVYDHILSDMLKPKDVDKIMALIQESSTKGYKQGVSDALFSPDEHSASETSARNTRLARSNHA